MSYSSVAALDLHLRTVCEVRSTQTIIINMHIHQYTLIPFVFWVTAIII